MNDDTPLVLTIGIVSGRLWLGTIGNLPLWRHRSITSAQRKHTTGSLHISTLYHVSAARVERTISE